MKVPAKYLFDLCSNWGVSRNQLLLIANTVDVPNFSFIPCEKKYDLITVGRLVPVRQIEEIIVIAAELGLSLCIVGASPLDQTLKNLARELDASVSFLGNIDQDSLPAIYNQIKIFVQNSQIEATSYALLEARASGLFTIVSELTGATEVIHHRLDGLLFGKGSGLDLMGAIKQAVGYTLEQLSNFGCKAREDGTQRFNREEVFNRIVEITKI